MYIDHRCRNRGCVNPQHLRLASAKQNAENRNLSRTNRTGVRGVRWEHRRGLWEARVGHNGKQILVGFFGSLDEADAAVRAKRRELYTHNDDDWDGIYGQLELLPMSSPGTGDQVHQMKRVSNA